MLPARELDAMLTRLKVRVDEQKRIDVASQLARALVTLPDARDTSRLPSASRELLHRVAECRGSLIVQSIPAGFEPLMARGILYARRVADGIEIVLPSAFLVQLPSWPGEDPRSLRALLAQAHFDTANAIASHYLGRPATPPLALALEAAWEAVSDPARLAAEIESLPAMELRLLESIEAEGGEVETAELLDLEREPMRLRSAKGVATTRRGAGFSLERRALLVPVHPNRHVVPREVAAIVGAERRRAQVRRRASIRSEVLADDHAPRRALFGRDVSALALALAIGVRESAADVRPNVGTPRSMLTKLAQRFGRSLDAVALVGALSRATGLWEPAALGTATPPGASLVSDIGPMLFRAWLRGGAWDEGRAEQELLRAPQDQREPSPIVPLREIVLEALLELGEDGWLPFGALVRYVREDPRVPGIERLLRRWAERCTPGAPAPSIELVVRRIALDSLPFLGLVDVGDDSRAFRAVREGADARDAPEVDDLEVPLRLGPRGRAYARIELGAKLDAEVSPSNASLSSPELAAVSEELSSGVHTRGMPLGASRFIDTQVLRVGGPSKVGHVLALAQVAEVGRVEDNLDLVLSPQAIARAISGGALGDEVRERIEAVAPLPESLSTVLAQVSVVVGKASLSRASGFLWIDDPDVRELLRTRRGTAELFVDPSPPGGLLVAPAVDLDRLVRRCRGLGVEVEVGEEVLRVATPRPPGVDAPQRSSVRPPSGKSSPAVRSKTPYQRSR